MCVYNYVRVLVDLHQPAAYVQQRHERVSADVVSILLVLCCTDTNH